MDALDYWIELMKYLTIISILILTSCNKKYSCCSTIEWGEPYNTSNTFCNDFEMSIEEKNQYEEDNNYTMHDLYPDNHTEVVTTECN